MGAGHRRRVALAATCKKSVKNKMFPRALPKKHFTFPAAL